MTTLPPKFIVGIGGSAGAIVAYKDFLVALSPRTGMAFVIVSHIIPTATSQLAEILSNRTKMPVSFASEIGRIQANHVYVCSPNCDLLIINDAFVIVTPRKKRNTLVDVFFTSLALAKGPRAIGIIFSGYDGDGAEGCRAIKAKGGTVFAQDASAEVRGMPLSAQATGCVDYVLSPEKIADQLQIMAKA